MKVLFLVPYPIGNAPSQRFRFEQYLEYLKQNNVIVKTSSFIGPDTWKVLYKPGHLLAKITGILLGFLKRTFDCIRSLSYDFVYIHREASPIGPPIFEFILAKILRKKIIYDFDDAIWLTNTSEANSFVNFLKSSNKVRSICKWSHTVVCGNQYLSDFAGSFNKNFVVIPTTIDMERVHKGVKTFGKKRIVGWTGTHSTMQYLNPLVEVFKDLEKTFDFELRIISNKAPEFQLASLKFIPWNKETEIADLLQIDIGIMPLVEDKWAQGKCGFKALQYMSLGIPSLISPVGVNQKFVTETKGAIATLNKDDWRQKLEMLLVMDVESLEALGGENKRYVKENYSVEANQSKMLALFKQA